MKLKQIYPKITATIIFIETIYLIYLIILTIKHYGSEIISLSSSPDIGFIITILFLMITGIGIIFSKRWSIIMFWVLLLLPLILRSIDIDFLSFFTWYTSPIYKFPFNLLNISLAIILSVFYWKEWGKPNN